MYGMHLSSALLPQDFREPSPEAITSASLLGYASFSLAHSESEVFALFSSK